MPIIKKYVLSEIKSAAEWLLNELRDRRIIALYGDMGAGKTTLVSAICELMKVSDVVSSPTFSIINEYHFDDCGGVGHIYHIDLYRLKDEEEVARAGVEDCFYGGDYCFIEWPQRSLGLLPPDTLHAHIRIEGDALRSLEIATN